MRKLLLSFIIGFLALPFFSHAITVGPVRMEYSVNPGDIVKGEMLLKNEGGGSRIFYPNLEKFFEENGQKVFSGEESEISKWIKTAKSVALKPDEQKIIPFSIEVPADASPGGHFAVMWWGNVAPNSEKADQVGVNTRAGILVYLTVSGNTIESGNIGEIRTNYPKSIINKLPVNFVISFENKGNVILKPFGELVIKNFFGVTKGILRVNDKGLIVMPNDKKNLETEWNSDFAFGPYKATANLVLGKDNQRIEKSIWVYVFPTKIVIGIVSVISLIIMAIIIKVIIKIISLIKRNNKKKKAAKAAKKKAKKRKIAKKNIVQEIKVPEILEIKEEPQKSNEQEENQQQ
ncbi:MAG: hypothetical protein PHN74_00705 [Candidatus Pacebacteria bacterium]|nr:hypothetical protein [Candidatus Paceibacterota bacterium]